MLRPYRKTMDRYGILGQPGSNRRGTAAARSSKYFIAIFAVSLLVSMNVFQKATRGISNKRGGIGRNLFCESGAVIVGLHHSLEVGQRFLASYCDVDTELETLTFRDAFEYNGETRELDDTTTRPSTDVAFVLTITSCDQMVDATLFYDAVAVLHDSVCSCTSNFGANSESNYTGTLYAIIHPDAVVCPGPSTGSGNGGRRLETSYQIDYVKILEEVGFWVIIWGTPVSSKTKRNP
mmetsp:Transcript_27149/g.41067  ORF Transcript_27149/g.41067 Transcript_27149/m.41067 type:complete len:236 (-) Transcript_27149:2006-2713(-)